MTTFFPQCRFQKAHVCAATLRAQHWFCNQAVLSVSCRKQTTTGAAVRDVFGHSCAAYEAGQFVFLMPRDWATRIPSLLRICLSLLFCPHFFFWLEGHELCPFFSFARSLQQVNKEILLLIYDFIINTKYCKILTNSFLNSYQCCRITLDTFAYSFEYTISFDVAISSNVPFPSIQQPSHFLAVTALTTSLSIYIPEHALNYTINPYLYAVMNASRWAPTC